MLCVCLGDPPSVFNWQARDKKKKFLRFKNLTPVDFAFFTLGPRNPSRPLQGVRQV